MENFPRDRWCPLLLAMATTSCSGDGNKRTNYWSWRFGPCGRWPTIMDDGHGLAGGIMAASSSSNSAQECFLLHIQQVINLGFVPGTIWITISLICELPRGRMGPGRTVSEAGRMRTFFPMSHAFGEVGFSSYLKCEGMWWEFSFTCGHACIHTQNTMLTDASNDY